MITKQQLKSIPKMQNGINRKRQQVGRLQSRAISIGASYSERVQTSGDNESMIYADEAIDIEREITETQRVLERYQKEAMQLAATLQDPQEQRLIRLRYVQCCTWETIAEVLGYSYRSVLRMHGRILSRLF